MNKRTNEESKENVESVKNGVSEAKFQNTQQIQETSDAKIDAGDSKGFTLEEKPTTGHVLKTEVASKTVKSSSLGGVDSGDGLNASGRAVSGNAGGVLGAANMTPIGGKARSETRYGKKQDRNSTKLNFIPNDQVLEEYQESKPLADAADLDQGFNGTYRNEFARSQKKVGNVPAELMFSRSVDFIEKDILYWPQGQYVKQTGVNNSDSPTKSAIIGDDGGYVNPANDNYSVPRGSYLNRDMKIGFDVNGKMRFMAFESEDVTAIADATVANKSSSAALRDRNRAELDREVMDSKAGDEKADIWSPLPRAVRQPTLTVGFLRDLEAMTGAEVGTAYKKATVSHSFQINRAHKDGQKVVTPMFDAFDGMYDSEASEAAINDSRTDLDQLFTAARYKKGSAALLIDAYDSKAKYKTKADVLIQPRSLRMHLQTADNNMNAFRIPSSFVQIYDNQEVFSTIDHEFDPMLPICFTDKCTLITSLAYSHLFTRVSKRVKLKYHSTALSEAPSTDVVLVPKEFNDKASGQYLHLVAVKAGVQTTPTISTSTGIITINNNIEKDIVCYINESSDKDFDTDDYIELVVNLSSYAGLDIAFDPTTKYYDVTVDSDEFVEPAKGSTFNYIYADLRNNYVTHVTFPLLEGMFNYLNDAGKCVLNKLYDAVHTAHKIEGGGNDFYTDSIMTTGWKVNIEHSTRHFSLWSFLVCAATPYIQNARINSMRDVIYYQDNVEYPFSDLIPLSDMTTRGYSNFTYVDYDHELETKVMLPSTAIRWVFPEFWTKIGSTSTSHTYILAPWYMNENNFIHDAENGVIKEDDDASNMSMPSIRSGSKLAALESLYSMTEKDVRLSLDCISSIKSWIDDSDLIDNDDDLNGAYKYGVMTDGIPYFAMKASAIKVIDGIKLPRELGYSCDAPYGLLTANVGNDYLSPTNYGSLVHGTSHRITYFVADGAVEFTTASGSKILDATGVNVDRAANFKQTWFTVFANGKQQPFDHGMVFSFNGLTEDDGDNVAGANLFKPYYTNAGAVTAVAGMASMLSLMKALWTRIQKLPFIISPFDAISASSTRTIIVDPFELAYAFGLCGFRASDYRESVYNREKQVVNQGYLFVSDPWVNDSPLFKEGAKSSGVPSKVGY